MGQIRVKINGRSYPINCEDGEEDHLRQLGGYLDAVVKSLTDKIGSKTGQISDTHLLVMAGITIADELSDSYAGAKTASGTASPVAMAGVAETFDSMAARIENIAASFENN
ncbi:MAG: cell division protein ZapA [Alphaproteobacteria bacterium]